MVLLEIALGLAACVPTGGRALDGVWVRKDTTPNQTPNASNLKYASQTAGAKLRSLKGNSPDRHLRSLN